MSDFPAVVLAKIFNFLSLSEKSKLARVCKMWKFVIETYDLPQRICFYSSSFPLNKRWYSTDQRVIGNEMLFLKADSKSSRSFNSKLKLF